MNEVIALCDIEKTIEAGTPVEPRLILALCRDWRRLNGACAFIASVSKDRIEMQEIAALALREKEVEL